MIRQKLRLEIDWDIPKEDEGLFKMAKQAILDETLKSFTGIYQAKISDGKEVNLVVFKPSDAMKKNFERIRAMKKKMVAMKKKK
jgi:hypothetical protein